MNTDVNQKPQNVRVSNIRVVTPGETGHTAVVSSVRHQNLASTRGCAGKSHVLDSLFNDGASEIKGAFLK